MIPVVIIDRLTDRQMLGHVAALPRVGELLTIPRQMADDSDPEFALARFDMFGDQPDDYATFEVTAVEHTLGGLIRFGQCLHIELWVDSPEVTS